MKWTSRSKTLAVNLLDMSGAGFLLRPFYGGQGAILCLHRVLPDDVPTLQPGIVVRVAQLREALRYAVHHGWEIVSLNEVPARLARKTRGSRRFLAITLDDGYLDNMVYGLPLFEEFNAPFTIFPVTGFISRSVTCRPGVVEALLFCSDRIVLEDPSRGAMEYGGRSLEEKAASFSGIKQLLGQPWLEHSLTSACGAAGLNIAHIMDRRYLSWEQLGVLSRNPLVTIGVHTVSHAALATLPANEAAREISASRQELETRLNIPIRHIAYPYGSPGTCGDREYRLAREMGFAAGYTTARGNLHPRHRDALWSLPRHTLSMVRHSANVRYVRLSLSGLWDALPTRMSWR